MPGESITVIVFHYSPQATSLLASSGKDRRLCFFSVEILDEKIRASHFLTLRKAHKRIVWDCSWFRDDHILTVSRDGVCKLWQLTSTPEGPSCDCLVEFSPFDGEPVTAIDVNFHIFNRIMVALGCENGRLSVWEAGISEAQKDIAFNMLTEANIHCKHGLTVKRVRWCPKATNDDFVLASVGEDHTVRIFTLCIQRNQI